MVADPPRKAPPGPLPGGLRKTPVKGSVERRTSAGSFLVMGPQSVLASPITACRVK
jgi:hypothetical protein